MSQTIFTAPLSVFFQTWPARWQIRAPVDDPGLAIFDMRVGKRADGRRLDAWKVREEFLAIPDTQALGRFLDRTGQFQLVHQPFSDLVTWQQLVGQLLAVPPPKWEVLGGTLPRHQVRAAIQAGARARFLFEWSKGVPALVLAVGFTLDAIVASIQVDHLRGAKFGFCQRPDCGTVYPILSRHVRKYCSHECGHLEYMRRERAAERQGTRSPK